MLLTIALFPLWLPRWWESNRSKLAVAAGLGAPVLVLYLARQPGALVHMAADYVSFIILLAGLYVIAGGVLLTGDLEATPLVNTAFLATGSLLASFVGTTGASMLLIRPLLMTNRERTRVTHTVIFFIFIVSNIGGMLTPLGGVVLAVAFLHAPWREGAIVAFAALSYWRTAPGIRRSNGFTTYPIVEVAALFLGIFLTMVPTLELLRLRGDALGVREPWQFFWATGVLSSFLDNAPTYLTFLALAQGLRLAPEVAGVPHAILAAISVGAVAMGANSYIGNAPNFMVKAIAEEAGVTMPSFGGYMLYSGAILLPLFVAVTLVFFR